MIGVNKILETDATGNCLRREGKAETLASILESQESSGSGHKVMLKTGRLAANL